MLPSEEFVKRDTEQFHIDEIKLKRFGISSNTKVEEEKLDQQARQIVQKTIEE